MDIDNLVSSALEETAKFMRIEVGQLKDRLKSDDHYANPNFRVKIAPFIIDYLKEQGIPIKKAILYGCSIQSGGLDEAGYEHFCGYNSDIDLFLVLDQTKRDDKYEKIIGEVSVELEKSISRIVGRNFNQPNFLLSVRLWYEGDTIHDRYLPYLNAQKGKEIS